MGITFNNCLQKIKSAMSNLDCPGDNPPLGNGKCFKGIENFLKRVAFNLGNTPSRTEVKIISCIPIDVSDLQQKIIYLEKQLEEARLCDEPETTCEQSRVCNTLFIENKFPVLSHTGVSSHTLEMDRGTNPYDQNTPTKKKSDASLFIPINNRSNVNACSSHNSEGPCTTDNKHYDEIIGYENDDKPFLVGDINQRQGRKNLFKKKKKAFRQKKFKNPYVYYTQTNSCNPFNRPEPNREATKARRRSYITKVMDKQYKPQVLGGNLSDISQFSSPICRDTLDFNVNYGAYESDLCSCCHGAFQNIDDQPILYDTQQLYTAQNLTNQGGFYDSTFYDVVPVKEKPLKVKKPSDMPKKRETKTSVDIMCWPEDVRTKLRTYPVYNPLYLDYTAIVPGTDTYLRKSPKMIDREPIVKNFTRRRNNIDRQINMEMSKSSCIDFGEVYPKLVRKRVDKEDRRLHIDKCLTATQVTRKVDAECLTVVTNNSECQTVSSIVDTKDSIQSSDIKTEETLNQIKTILQTVLHEVKVSSLSKGTSGEKQKKDATVQKGISQGNMPGPLHMNVAGLLQDNTGRLVQDNLSGLTNSNLSRGVPGLIPSHMAESLQTNLPGNVQGSRLLNSFTYSPYDISPYLPSCSKQMNSNPYYYSQAPLKCFQNFPLIVQNHGRPTCASCFRHSAHIKSCYGRQAQTIATNTETVKVEHSKETEKLIKEIYRSMALTMGAVQKENSSEYEPLRDFSAHVEKSTRTVTEKPAAPVKEFKKVTNVVQAVSELFRKRDMQVSSDSHNLIESKYGSHKETTESRYGSRNTNTATESKQISTAATTFSHTPTTNTHTPTTNTEVDVKIRKERVDKYFDQSKRKLPEGIYQDKRKFYTAAQNIKNIVEVSETSSSETDTDVTFVPTKQVIQKDRKEKQGLFSKMFRSVKLFKPRERKKGNVKDSKAEELSTEDSSSDSDDYQTVYSQKIEATAKHRPKAYNLTKRRTHSKISYRHMYQRDRSPEKYYRRSPYMEQEYRRYWNENLMFDKYPKHSVEHPHSQRYPSDQTRRSSPYYQTYEARAALIQPKFVPRPNGTYGKVAMPKQIKTMTSKIEPKFASKAMPWLKKHKIGKIRCAEHFKQLVRDN